MNARHGLAWIAALVLQFPVGAHAQLPEYGLERTVRIGSLNDPETALDVVTQLATTPDGGIAVAQPTDAVIWIFSPSGTRLRVVGGRGDGPGEFQAISSMGWRGDTLWAADGQPYRVTFLDLERETVTIEGGADRRVEGVIRAPFPAGDGLWVLYRRWTLDQVARTYREEIWSADERWRPVELLGNLPDGPDGFRIEQLPGGLNMREQPHPLAQHPLFVVAPDVSSFTTVRREIARRGYTVTRVGIGGDTVFHRDYAVELPPVTRETRSAIIEHHLSDEALQRVFPSLRTFRTALESALNFPDVHPAVTRVVVGLDGSTWLRGPDDRSGTVRWTILDATGEPRFTVRTAREIGMFHGHIETQNAVRMAVDERGFWAVEEDDLEVQYVVRYELRPVR